MFICIRETPMMVASRSVCFRLYYNVGSSSSTERISVGEDSLELGIIRNEAEFKYEGRLFY